MSQPQLDLSPVIEDRDPFHVRCGACQHVWIAAYFPMEMSKAGRLLKGVRCPMCTAGGNQIFIANAQDIKRIGAAR